MGKDADPVERLRIGLCLDLSRRLSLIGRYSVLSLNSGSGSRRCWTVDDKTRIVAETLETGASAKPSPPEPRLRLDHALHLLRNGAQRPYTQRFFSKLLVKSQQTQHPGSCHRQK
jgi:hypothetical protein